MTKLVSELVSTNRIVVSRIFAAIFFAVVLMVESAHEGTLISPILFLTGLALAGAATVGRLWCALYISGWKDNELITSGPYSISRNPLYFFSFLGFAGIGLASETSTLGLALTIPFLLIYRPVIAREEASLRARFGEKYDAYRAQTPRLLPAMGGYHEPQTYVVKPRLFRRTVVDAVWFIWFVGIVEFVEALHEYHFIEPLFRLP